MATTITTNTLYKEQVFIPPQQQCMVGRGAKQTATYNATETLVDCSAGSFFQLTFGAGNIAALTLINPQPGQTIQLELTQDGTGSRLVSAWTQFLWAGGTAPTLTTTASATDIVEAIWDDVRAKWIGLSVFKALA